MQEMAATMLEAARELRQARYFSRRRSGHALMPALTLMAVGRYGIFPRRRKALTRHFSYFHATQPMKGVK